MPLLNPIEEEHMVADEDEKLEEIEMDDEEDEELEDGEEEENDSRPRVYLPTRSDDAENLEYDESAYVMYHQAQAGSPCLSFDIIRDGLGDNRTDFPLTTYLVAGSQAARVHVNNIIVMKMTNLKETKKHADSEDESDDDDDDDEEELPSLTCAMIKHTGCINRIRTAIVNNQTLVAAWSELGKVSIWNLERPLQAVDDAQSMISYVQNAESPSSLFSFGGHLSEGFALDWCPTRAGTLATGDCRKNIHVWKMQDAGKWHVDQRPFSGHTASVEDIQWSPNEADVFASCSVDKSIRIWDCRISPDKACMLTAFDAHESDVNVISWNAKESFILSGGDDGAVKVWDLRMFQQNKSTAVFKHHTAPITSVEWNPNDSTVFAASGADDQLTLWDLAVERDAEIREEEGLAELPPQLLFIHQGQKDIKELHWHSQLPGVILSTAHSGFDIFRTISV